MTIPPPVFEKMLHIKELGASRVPDQDRVGVNRLGVTRLPDGIETAGVSQARVSEQCWRVNGEENESGVSGGLGDNGFRFGKSLVLCRPHPGGVCNVQKGSGFEATELGSVYGKWEARFVGGAAVRVSVPREEMEVGWSHG
jgi:hypothetical protein